MVYGFMLSMFIWLGRFTMHETYWVVSFTTVLQGVVCLEESQVCGHDRPGQRNYECPWAKLIDHCSVQQLWCFTIAASVLTQSPSVECVVQWKGHVSVNPLYQYEDISTKIWKAACLVFVCFVSISPQLTVVLTVQMIFPYGNSLLTPSADTHWDNTVNSGHGAGQTQSNVVLHNSPHPSVD